MKSRLTLICLLLCSCMLGQNLQKGKFGYLYCHMSRDGEWTSFAISRDGIHYQDLLGGKPIFDPESAARIEGGTRDAYICRRHDGKGYLMVTTDMCVAKSHRWNNYGIDLLTSDDLINWKSTTFDFRTAPFVDPESEDVFEDWSKVCRVWAPQVIWDEEHKAYLVYFSMLNSGDKKEQRYDKVYYCYADETFTKLTKPKVLFDWGYATIDADINWLESDGKFHMLIKKEGGKTGIFTTSSKSLLGPWPQPSEDDFVSFEGRKMCEGSSAFQPIGRKTWYIAYVEYSSNPARYRICEADENMRNFHNPQDIQGVSAPQHGSFMRLTRKEYKRLEKLISR